MGRCVAGSPRCGENDGIAIASAVAHGAGSLTSLLNGIEEREARRAVPCSVNAAATAAPHLSFDETEVALRRRLNDWRGMLADAPGPARRILRTLLAGRIILRPDHGTGQCSFTGRANLREAFAGLLQPIGMVPRTGIEPVTPAFSVLCSTD